MDLLKLLSFSDEGANGFFTASLRNVGKNEDDVLLKEDLRAWDLTVLRALEEASRDGDGIIMPEEIQKALLDSFDLELSLVDAQQMVLNRDVTGDGLLTPGELFPGSLSTQTIIPDDGGKISQPMWRSIMVATLVMCVWLLR